MPILIPSSIALPKNIKTSKSGINIDELVRSSFSCAIKNNFSKFTRNTADCITKLPKSLDRRSELDKITSSDSKHKNFKVIVKPSLKKHQPYSKLEENGNIVIKKENTDSCLLDDSLTNLQWLTDVKINDILEGKPIHYAPLSPAPSNSSDDGDTKTLNRRDTRYFSDSSVDYRTNEEVKPPYSYAALIIMAMKSKACQKMTLSEIYKWITANFVFYKHADPSWQNSIRHNLSLNKCFAKIPRNKGDPGKGGYWRIVPEFANKLLESNIRKRRSSMIDYNCQDIIKRQRLDLFESQLLCKIKPEIKAEQNSNQTLISHHRLYDRSNQHTPIQADLEQCRMDHPYGKNPCVKYNISDEENIKALANNLQLTTLNVDILNVSLNTDSLANSQTFNTFSSAIMKDCIWSSHQNQNDHLTESMTKVTEELLEARNQSTSNTSPILSKILTNSLNSSGASLLTSPFCLSPPLSGDDEGFSDSFSDDLDDNPPVFTDDINLTVRGTSMTLFEPMPGYIEAFNIKEEPISPISVEVEK